MRDKLLVYPVKERCHLTVGSFCLSPSKQQRKDCQPTRKVIF
jgi:hypothetical protein